MTPTVEPIRPRDPAKAGRLRWLGVLPTIPGIGASLLPIGVCPACWPVYAGLLGALGIGFLLSYTYLLPVTGLLLILALFSLGYRASSRHGYGPLLVGSVAVGIVVASKFVLASDSLLYLGVALLILASIRNTRPVRTARDGTCPSCSPTAGSIGSLRTSERRIWHGR